MGRGPGPIEISVLLVNDRRMRELNLQYRGIDKTTDVLSFPLLEPGRGIPVSGSASGTGNLPLGDIVISIPQTERQAAEYGEGFYSELSRLLVHGFLHLLGYDHEGNRYQAGKMRKIEAELAEIVCH